MKTNKAKKKAKTEISKIEMFLSQLAALAFDVGASFGVFLVIYGTATLYYNQPWAPLESILKWATPIVGLIGFAAVVISIYFPQNPTPPKRLSKYFTAPVILTMIACAFIVMFYTKKPIPDSISIGFSLAAIFSGLMRLFPRLTTKNIKLELTNAG